MLIKILEEALKGIMIHKLKIVFLWLLHTSTMQKTHEVKILMPHCPCQSVLVPSSYTDFQIQWSKAETAALDFVHAGKLILNRKCQEQSQNYSISDLI